VYAAPFMGFTRENDNVVGAVVVQVEIHQGYRIIVLVAAEISDNGEFRQLRTC
jgi:hypothetical protein